MSGKVGPLQREALKGNQHKAFGKSPQDTWFQWELPKIKEKFEEDMAVDQVHGGNFYALCALPSKPENLGELTTI